MPEGREFVGNQEGGLAGFGFAVRKKVIIGLSLELSRVVEFAVVAEGITVQEGVVPDEAAAGVEESVSPEVVGAAVAHAVLLAVGRDDTLDAPGVAIGRIHPIAVIVVEQRKAFREGMVVGRDLARKVAELRFAVALAHIAEDLVECPVLLDDIDDVLDDGRLADFGWYGYGFGVGVGGAGRGAEGMG